MTTRRLLPTLALGALLLPGTVAARSLPPGASGGGHWCDTHPTKLQEVVARHFDSERRLERETPQVLRSSVPRVEKVGNVAVIEDDGRILRPPNPFDLAGDGLSFTRRAQDTISAGQFGGPFRPALGEKLPLGDDDSVRVDFPQNWRFRIYDRTFTSMFVNSDGNITFERGDSASTARSVGRFLNGPPRIAPLFTDLDPASATGEGGVYFRMAGNLAIVTWYQVPEFGVANSSSFQVTLARSGRITFTYEGIDAADSVVGVSPGGAIPADLIDFDEEVPWPRTSQAIAEEFTAEERLDNVAIGEVFFENFADDYDHLVVWLDFAQSLGNAFAFEVNVKNDVAGIGLEEFDFSDVFGSNGRLESYVQMGSLENYPNNPNIEFLGTNSTLEVLGQEAGHRWLAFTGFLDAQGNVSSDILGRDLAHWSFFTDSDASVMEGNDIRDNGDGSFTTVRATEGFSPLDQYLMGLRAANEVPDFFYVSGSSVRDPADGPEVGVTFSGNRVNVGVDDIIAVHGPRLPAAGSSPRNFKMAFVIVGREGERPSQESISKVDRIRRRWHGFFKRGTDRRGQVSTVLRK